MDKLILLGLAKAIEKLAKTEEAREAVKPGAYNLDQEVVIHLSGSLKVGEDSEYTPTTSIPYKTAMALFLRYSGVTRDAAMNALVKAMTDAIKLGAEGEESAELVAAMADIAEAEATVQKGLDALPNKTKLGAVTQKLQVEFSNLHSFLK
jgi:hypothetical protein